MDELVHSRLNFFRNSKWKDIEYTIKYLCCKKPSQWGAWYRIFMDIRNQCCLTEGDDFADALVKISSMDDAERADYFTGEPPVATLSLLDDDRAEYSKKCK